MVNEENAVERFGATAESWRDFRGRWGGLHNFLVGESVTGFAYEIPPLRRIIEEVREHPTAIVRSGIKGDVFDLTDIKTEFRRLPIEEAMRSQFVLAHFSLVPDLCGRGQLFEGIEERWVEPWRQSLLANGFTFERVFPILFCSGPGSASNYHMDKTHQLAWQRYGTKHFHALKDPDRWTTQDERRRCELHGMNKPAEVGPGDIYSVVQPPDTALWNAIATPHWVETFDSAAATLTLVHEELRLEGRLCPHGEDRARWLASEAVEQR